MCFCQEKMATWIAVSSEVPSYTSAQDFHRFRHCHVRFVHVFTRLYSQRRSFELTSLWNLMLPLGNWLLWLLWLSTTQHIWCCGWVCTWFYLCWVCAGLGRAFLAFSWLSVPLQSLCISYHVWTIAHEDVWYHVCAKNCFSTFYIASFGMFPKIQRYRAIYATPCGHSEELVHVSVTWCRCVLMDGTFTGPCGCQSQIVPESCLGYMLLVRCFYLSVYRF